MKKAKNSNSIKFVIAISVIISIISLTLYINNRVIKPQISKISYQKILAMSTAAINNAVFHAMTDKSDYKELVQVHTDNNGKIDMIKADSVKINALARETAKIAGDYIAKQSQVGIDLQLGTLLNIPYMMTKGMAIHIETMPIGKVDTDYYSEFESVGINQTRHKIMVSITSTVEVISPFDVQQVVATTDVLVCENILLGSVPDVYLKGEK